MGQVAVTFKVMPESPDTDLVSVKEKIKAIGAEDIREDPVGFGLTALSVLFVFDDKQGADTDALAEKIKAIDGIASVESGEATLL